MKNFKTIIFAGLAPLLIHQAVAQDTFTSEHFAKNTYSFTIEKGKMSGQGADLLNEAIDGSQFFLLGEYHNDAGISEITAALLPLLAKEGYKHFAVETGPLAANKIEELGKSKDVKTTLNQFYTSHVQLTGDIPVPFFQGIEDAEFLEIAMKNGYDLWGLDQEYLGGYLFLLEEAWKNAGMPENLRTEYEAGRKKLMEAYAEVGDKETSEVYNVILADELIQDLLEKLNKTACRSCFSAADEMIASCEIYRDWKADLLENLEGRTDLMKDHFRTYYQNSAEQMPKVFVKMGGMHTARGLTGNADYEVGNMLYELAAFNGSHDVNVAFATRYYLDEETGEIGDNLDFESTWTENMTPLLSVGDKEVWKIIDLRPLKKMWINERIKPNRQIRQYLAQNDFVIIMPAKGENTPNYDVSLAIE
ncbi:hypothetical protein O3Q51_12950 [Cryomorphaceae bacterium 1068]|nr:hypothetical protein [Cryomorphaceae bacterium 1068]